MLIFPVDDISKRVSAKDLLIVSKIMRRAPPIAPSDEGLRVHRLALARLLLTCASDLGYPEAQMFWAEETLSNSQYPKEEADKALRLLTDLGGQAVQPSTERRQASPDAPPPIAARANFLLGQYLWAAGEMVESTQQRKNLRDRALAHFERAGEQGHGQAYFVLGQKYRAQGQAAKAQAAYEKAHAAGNAEATFMLAQSTKDESKRKTLLATAAGGGSLSAAHNLGEVYRQSGQDALAIEYYTLAARAGVFISQSNLAELYLKRGDFDKAEHWFMAVSKAPEGNVKKGTRSKDDVASFAKTRLEQMQQSQAYIDHQNAKTKGGGSCIVM
jgi:tetratricopeptide (TPR) repeat protein